MVSCLSSPICVISAITFGELVNRNSGQIEPPVPEKIEPLSKHQKYSPFSYFKLSLFDVFIK